MNKGADVSSTTASSFAGGLVNPGSFSPNSETTSVASAITASLGVGIATPFTVNVDPKSTRSL